MQQLLVLPILLSLVLACAYSQPKNSMGDLTEPSSLAAQSEPLSAGPTSGRSELGFKLSDQQWQHRVVLIFAPDERSSAYQQQMQAWQSDAQGLRERDLKLVQVFGKAGRADGQPMTLASVAQLRQQFGVAAEEFAVILVGKDGTEKQRSQTPINLSMLFQTIDAMPMRQQEMRSQW